MASLFFSSIQCCFGGDMLIVKISDPHVFTSGEKADGIASAGYYLRRCINHLDLARKLKADRSNLSRVR